VTCDAPCVQEEIESQPAVWRQAEALAGEVAPMLAAPGQRVAFFGCGTSFYVAQAAAAVRGGESDAFPASEFPAGRRYDLAVALSRSGTTSEVLSAIRSLCGATPVIAVTADPASPVARLSARTVAMPFADERSVIQTRFATAALALLRAAAGQDLGGVVAAAEEALGSRLPVAPARVRQWVFLGRGWSVGLAFEAALKVREAAQAWSEAYPAMEYRHGPISVADPSTVVWALDELPAGLEQEIARTGARLVTAQGDPMAELVRVQRLAVALANARGLDPDRPRNLTRSVVLDGGGALHRDA
jgi:fructoselysine-6-P-deglycase FrlB-like protein